MPSHHRAVAAATLLAACAPRAVAPAARAYRSDPAELVAAERAFMNASRERGVEGWASFFADSGAQIPDRGPVVVGRDAIRRHMQGAFSDPAVQLRWEPTKAEVSSAGDMGYTYGRWQIVARDSAGAEQERARGKYITVWKRAPNGEWKVAVDGGNQEPRASR